MTSIDSIVARLTALHPKLIDLSLDRMWRILDALGNPQQRLPPVIHVAGTNGKGSTIAFMRAILEAAGLSVHVYTSPHLVRFNERFRLGAHGASSRAVPPVHSMSKTPVDALVDGLVTRANALKGEGHEGRLASDEELADALAECERANAGAPITVFEITTAAGLVLFARHPADVLLLEVGLGGRLDATNVVERPLASVITPVSFDHAEHLGDTIGKIAGEKAGILKPGVPAIVAAQPREALIAIERQAARVKAPIKIAGEDWTATEERGRLVYQDDDGLLDLPAPKLYGRHQFENAGVAIAALRAVSAGGFRRRPAPDPTRAGERLAASNAIPLELSSAAFEAGIAKADWPARMQRLSHGLIAELAPAGSELWLDGGHNADGGRAIANALADLEERVSRPLVLVVGMLATKDCESFLRNFAGLARRIVAVPIPHQENTLSAAAIADIARTVGIPAQSAESLESALAVIGRFDLDPPPRILITGSLYLAGEVLNANGTLPS
jgi:dihydrofolate synthase/folylpolyglutamate synthase